MARERSALRATRSTRFARNHCSRPTTTDENPSCLVNIQSAPGGPYSLGADSSGDRSFLKHHVVATRTFGRRSRSLKDRLGSAANPRHNAFLGGASAPEPL